MLTTWLDTELDQLPGLRRAMKAFRKVLESRDSVHAVLFAGQQGSGAERLAKLLAQGWMCLDPTSWPCGSCAVCAAMGRGTAVDYLEIEPLGASRLITIKQFRDVPSDRAPETIPLLSFFRTRPLQAMRKVVWIRDADRMNETASNTLLKTLEEPPDHAKLVLTTDSVSRLAPTVLSRCLLIHCELQDISEMAGNLHPAEAAFGEGAPDRIDHIRTHIIAYERILATCQALEGVTPGRALRCSEDFRHLGEHLGESAKMGTRAGNAEVLRCLGLWWEQNRADQPRGLQQIAESHRLILGNVNSGVVFDALFASLLTN